MKRRDFLRLLVPAAAAPALAGPALLRALEGLAPVPVPMTQKSSAASFSINSSVTVGGAFLEDGRNGTLLAYQDFDRTVSLRDGDEIEIATDLRVDGDWVEVKDQTRWSLART